MLLEGLEKTTISGSSADGFFLEDRMMTPKKFYDWMTAGGTDDVMRMVDCLERADIAWCAIGGIAVNHWADEH